MSQSFFDGRAETWDEDNPVPASRLWRVVDLCHIAPGHSVLDVGTGTGRLVPLLLERVGPGGRVVGVDPSPGMLVVARRRHQAPNLRFVQAAAEALPLPGLSLDRVVCYSVFPHFADRGAALRELARVLRPGGLAAVAHTDGRETINALHRAAGLPVAGDRLPPAVEVARLLEERGFRVNAVMDDPDFFFVAGAKVCG